MAEPISNETALPTVAVNCIALDEAMAEKFRAALSRKDVAIRDFYDLDYAAMHLGTDLGSDHMVNLVRQKLAVPGNLPVDVSKERFAALTRQLDARLRTVLRDKEFREFDMDRAIRLVTAMTERLS